MSENQEPEMQNQELDTASNKSSDISNQIRKRISKSSKANVAKKSLVKALMPIITYALVFIIILIIIIGIVLFFITMPGMVMENLKKLSMKIGNKFIAFFGGDTTQQIDKQQIYDVLDYLEQMGYDLKGYGFLTDYVGEEEDGVTRNDEGCISEAESDFIFTYLSSDNYVYTIANFNQVNSLANNGHRILGGLLSIFQKLGNFCTNGQLAQFWGRGMLSIYHEYSVGVPGAYYGGLDDWLGWSDVKIVSDENTGEKKLQIRRGYGSESKEFNLEGWTGRYGMPLEFLLSIHVATMMPDLAYDMVENFDTQVVILLHKTGSYFNGTSTYDPYVSYVKNHWYRDVYFVQADKEFVSYDYDYEAVTKERWSLYETYEESDNKPDRIGEYKLYELDENGNYKEENGKYVLFDGTQKEAEEKNISVAKKAVTLKYENEDDFNDIQWNKNGIGIWSAYKISDEGSIIQTGEGLRTETNADIKKMFLENTYFRYDGSQETAEIITKLRKQHNIEYGSLDDSDLDKKVTVDGKAYKVSDFSGQVSLNQDSLNAFSMLENEHTLDSDYIYRDFKELIVELGYFDKKELTDETPRLLQWAVPDTGSYGYPNRAIDKNEKEYGTMIHSKGDINVANDRTLRNIIESAQEYGEPETPPEPEGQVSLNNQSQIIKKKIISDSSSNIIGQVASIENTPISNMQTVGAITDVAPADYTYTPTGSTAQHTKIADLEFNGVNYECWFQTRVTCTLYSFAFVASAYTDTPYEQYVQETAPYWCPGLSFGCFKTAGVEGVYYGVDEGLPSIEEQGTLISEALNEGKPIYFYSGLGSSAGTHAIVLLGASENGKVLYFNPWGGVIQEYGSASSFASNLNELLTSGVHDKGGSLYSFFIPAEPPDGVKKQGKGEQYVGYKGNEAVVSPVTGILLEYGTYTNEIDSISGEEYRVNVDLKYGTNAILNADKSEQNPDSDARIVHDKVGYAKILVLDKENYAKLEALLKSKTEWKNSTLLANNGNYKNLDISKDIIKEWNDAEKTLYGYKEFAEKYEEFGIAGNVLYIDGFKCEMPDEEFDTENADKSEEIPQGKEIKLKDFKEITKNNFDGSGKLNINSELLLNTLYEKDEEIKMASSKATEKLNAENDVKAKAALTIYDQSNELIFIKEGTTLGRTLTDRELIEEYRHEQYGDYRKDDNSSDDFKEKVVGNYINIVMRDTDKTVVENIEDYMKLDDGEVKHTENDWELFFWLPFESGAADTKPSYIEGRFTGPVCVSTCSEGEVGVGIIQETSLTDDGMCNQRDQLIPFMKENYPQFYTILSFLDGKDATYYWEDYKGGNAVQSALQRCDKLDHEEFLSAQMEEAKEYYLKPLLEDKPWLEERPSCVQGAVLHLRVWGAGTDGITQNMSDEAIIAKVRYTIANTSSTAGEASGDETKDRAFSEPEIAFGILDGRLSEDDVEQWVRTNDISILTENGVEYRGP